MEKVFPTIMMFLSVCASIAYVIKGDMRGFVYWLAATVLTFAVTWL